MQLHIVEVVTTLLLAMLMMPMQASAAFSHSKKLNTTQNAEYPSAPILQRIKQESQLCKDEWSGSLDDLKALVNHAKQKYGFENTKHLGRNATMLIPANLAEMRKYIERGNPSSFSTTFWDGAHSESADSDDWDITWFFKSFGSGVTKYVNANGDEAVYDSITGKCLTDTKLGTKNVGKNGLWSATFGEHSRKDMMPHKSKATKDDRFSKDGDQYKYVGILYETDQRDPNKFYIIDGQTGMRMTKRQAEEFPTTLSDMWKGMGLACVSDDANDVIEPDACRDEAKCIDTSKLESLLEEAISFLTDIIAKGKRVTNTQVEANNQRVKEMMEEFMNIGKQIYALNVSEEEKKKIAEKALVRVSELMSQFAILIEKVTSMGLVQEASFEEKSVIVNDALGNLSVAPRDVKKTKGSSAKATGGWHERTITGQ